MIKYGWRQREAQLALMQVSDLGHAIISACIQITLFHLITDGIIKSQTGL